MTIATWMKVAPLALGAAALLASCGGGGGNAGGGDDTVVGVQSRNVRADQNHGAEVREVATDLTERGKGLDLSKLAHLIEVAQSNRPTAGEASASMVSLTYNGPTSWFRRVLSTSATQSIPDADGWIRTWDRRERTTAGQHATWSFGNEPARQSDVHWNGSAWVGCALNHEIASTPADANGAAQYNYCDSHERGSSQRSFFSIEGRTMLEVYQSMRSAGATNVFIANTSVLGSAVFPAGSMLVTQTNTPTHAAVAYYPGLGNAVRDPIPALAAADPATCRSISASTPLRDYTSYSTSLESMVQSHRGTPCVFLPDAQTGPRNEWWTQATVPLWFLPANPPSGGYYTGGTLLRAAFPGGSAINFYACQHRFDGSTRNCNMIGSSTFSIESLGDARVMRLGTLPPQIAALAWAPLIVERAGKVWVGYQNDLLPTSTARLNLAGLNALSTQLGLQPVDPAVPLATTPASFQGQWVLGVAGTLDSQDTMTLTISPTPQGLGAFCIEDKSNLSLDCSTFGSFDATGNFTLLTRNDFVAGKFEFARGTASGTLYPPAGSTAPVEPMEGMRR